MATAVIPQAADSGTSLALGSPRLRWFVRKWKRWDVKTVGLAGALGALVVGTIGAGLYFRHYYVVSMFAVWLAVEFGMWRFASLWKREAPANETLPRLSSLLTLYDKSDAHSESLLQEKMTEARFAGSLSDYERRWLERLRDLIELRGLAFGKPAEGRRALRQAFLAGNVPGQGNAFPAPLLESLTEADITQSAAVVADLYWKLYHASVGEFPDLRLLAERLFYDLFGVTPQKGRDVLETASDSMQRHGGVPYLMLNLLRLGRIDCARTLAERLLTQEVRLEEDLRSTLYWMSEMLWFQSDAAGPIEDFETTIRYLYHLCFTNSDRAGFLEIDSPFFSEFETVSELAREGLLFKETLVERVLGLWGEFPKSFDGVFRGVMETLSGQRSKVYDRREAWVRFWEREQENFGKDLLAVVEGNLCYAQGHVEDAYGFYERALEISPKLRSALYNQLFCVARMGDGEALDELARKLLRRADLFPSVLHVVGDAYLVAGRADVADEYYDELRTVDGWRLRADYYRSTFCLEHGLKEAALEAARRAAKVNPNDPAIQYHLSKCYNAVGDKGRALDVLKATVLPPMDWVRYYQFTLERDVGRTQEASQTLLTLAPSYFEDPDELEQALEFARTTQDLTLLRHLKAVSE